MNIIEVRDLCKTFKARHRGEVQEVEAVRGIDLTVQEKEVFGFLGPNGAGKTTTLRMLTTLIPPDSGTATIAGHDLSQNPKRVRECIGYVSQAGGTDPHLNARENLVLQAQLYGMEKAQAQDRAEELIHALDLASFADRMGKTYSGGQKRRLDMALSMCHRPSLLFLDEPTTGLDPQSRAQMWQEIGKLRDLGTTVFLTTHYMDEADTLCDRLAIIDNGEIVAEGTPDTLKRQIAGDAVTVHLESANGAVKQAQNLLDTQPFVRELHPADGQLQLYVERGEEALPAILRLLDGANLTIQGIALSRPSLDDVFLRKTGRSLIETGTD